MRKLGFTRTDTHSSYYWMVFIHSSWFIAILTEHTVFPLPLPTKLTWLALVTFFAAQALRLWALRSLDWQWNVNIMTLTKTVESQCDFVKCGPYQFIRHPNYLAVIVEFISLPLMGAAPRTTIIWSMLNGLVLFYRIRNEENALCLRPGYRQVMMARPRFIPSLESLRRKKIA